MVQEAVHGPCADAKANLKVAQDKVQRSRRLMDEAVKELDKLKAQQHPDPTAVEHATARVRVRTEAWREAEQEELDAQERVDETC